MRKKEVLELILLLGLLFGFLPHLARADTAMLQYDSNSYYETARIAYNMEDKLNSTHFYDFGLNGLHGREYVGTDIAGYFGRARTSSINVSVPNPVIVSQPWTIEAWVYPTTDLGEVGAGRMLFARLTGNSKYISLTNGYMTWNHYGITAVSNQSLSLNQWVHVALTYDSGVAKWFINGTEHGTATSTYYPDWDYNDLWLGLNGQVSYTQWSGIIDEFRIYRNKALTQAQIQTDMATSMAVKLTVEGLTKNTDIAQLWYNATTLFEQKTADINGKVEWNVYAFSNKITPYQGIIKIYHEDIQYEGPVLVLYWGDIYTFSVVGLFEDLFIQLLYGAGAWIGTLIILTTSMGLTFKWKESTVLVVPVLLFLSLDFLGRNLMWQTIIMLSAATFFVLNFAKKMRH